MDDSEVERIISAPRRFAKKYPFRMFFVLFALQFSIPLATALFGNTNLEVDLGTWAMLIWLMSLLWLAAFRYLWPKKWF